MAQERTCVGDAVSERARILIVDEDPVVASSIASALESQGYETALASDGRTALERLENAGRGHADAAPRPFQVLICDMAMARPSGLELIKSVRERHPDVVPIAITGYGTIESAVKAIRQGAIDYLTKPMVDDELCIAVEKAVRQQALIRENCTLRSQLDQRYGFDNIIGNDHQMRRQFDLIGAVAASKTTVLMCGESGTGKSMIARAIHHHSAVAKAPFVEISCGSIPETLLESELFGHVKGAFTGAHTDKPGRFLAAHGGTLFLDEINAASPGMQLKLLRVLQERTFEPVGSNAPVEVDVRVVLASNQPLEELVARGEFRQDLYYRINVVKIQLPPLRDRVGDIPALANHFLAAKSKEAGKQVTTMSAEVVAALRSYPYPGNVRELENIIERAVVLTRTPGIGLEDLPPHVIDGSASTTPAAFGGIAPASAADHRPMPLREALETPEKQIILAALEANAWNRQQTADELEINRTTLYKKIKQYGLEEYGQAG